MLRWTRRIGARLGALVGPDAASARQGLAYSALVLRDQGLAAEVSHLEDRLDEMKERLELWVLRAAHEHPDPSTLRGLLHLSQAAEEIGDAAEQMVWLIQEDEELHPILALALGGADELVPSGHRQGS